MLFNTSESMAESTMSGKNNNSLVVPIMEAGGGSGGGGDGSSIEIAKRPRGRPPGSKNKPKPPVIITRDSDPSSALRPHILEIPSGADVIDSIAKFSRRKNIGICVLAGTGAVSNVVLRQPPHPTTEVPSVTAAATTVGFHGRLEILSLSATVMPPAAAGVVATPGVTVSLAGPQGQVIGGAVVGPLVAAGMVTVVAAAFDNPTFHRLPVVEAEDHHDVAESSGGGGSGKMKREKVEAEEQQHYEHNRREYARHHHHRQQEQQEVQMVDPSCGGGMTMYSSHFPAEVIWAPGVRPPHPPPY